MCGHDRPSVSSWTSAPRAPVPAQSRSLLHAARHTARAELLYNCPKCDDVENVSDNKGLTFTQFRDT